MSNVAVDSAVIYQEISVRLENLDVTSLCHEELDMLDLDDLDDLVRMLLSGDGLDGVLVHVNEEGRPVVVQGHRWVVVCRMLAEQGAEGFTSDMSLLVVEVTGADPQVLLLLSLEDPVVRFKLHYFDRLCISLKLQQAGIEPERAATSLDIPIEVYDAMLTRACTLDL